MPGHRIFGTPFGDIYPLYVAKAERKGRTRAEVDTVLTWLTGYDEAGLAEAVAVLEIVGEIYRRSGYDHHP